MTVPNRAYLTTDLLSRPAVFATRIVADVRLDACVSALDALESGAPDALHDLRVSLRRLRSWLRSFRPHLDDTVRRKHVRRVHRLVRATNGARDLEVWNAWIAEQTDLSPRARYGAKHLTARLSSESDELNADATARVRRRLPKIVDALRDELSCYSLRVRDDRGANPGMSSATADVLRDECRRLRRRIERIESDDDVSPIHRTRIAAKNLRYVVETLEPRTAAMDVANMLVELQDGLGVVHDMQLLVERIVLDIEAGGAADARRRVQTMLALGESIDDDAPPRRAVAGLTEIARRARQRAHDEFERFAQPWFGPRLDTVDALVSGIADELEALV